MTFIALFTLGDSMWHMLPRTALIVLAGCTGLAWGALWRLPCPEEVA